MGLDVTAVDNLADYIEEINKISRIRMLAITAMQLDVKEYS